MTASHFRCRKSGPVAGLNGGTHTVTTPRAGLTVLRCACGLALVVAAYARDEKPRRISAQTQHLS